LAGDGPKRFGRKRFGRKRFGPKRFGPKRLSGKRPKTACQAAASVRLSSRLIGASLRLLASL
jgi:hypothetical protein